MWFMWLFLVPRVFETSYWRMIITFSHPKQMLRPGFGSSPTVALKIQCQGLEFFHASYFTTQQIKDCFGDSPERTKVRSHMCQSFVSYHMARASLWFHRYSIASRPFNLLSSQINASHVHQKYLFGMCLAPERGRLALFSFPTQD